MSVLVIFHLILLRKRNYCNNVPGLNQDYIKKHFPFNSYLRANWKLAEELAETFLGLSEGLLPAEETKQNNIFENWEEAEGIQAYY